MVSDGVDHHKAVARCAEVWQANQIRKEISQRVHRELTALVWCGHENDAADVLPGFEVDDFQKVFLGCGADFQFLRWTVRELFPEIFSTFSHHEAGNEAPHAVANDHDSVEVRVFMGGVHHCTIPVELGAKFGCGPPDGKACGVEVEPELIA